MKGSLKMWIFVSLWAFLGLSLVGLILFILKNREAIDEELAMSDPIEPSKIDKSQPYMPELGWY